MKDKNTIINEIVSSASDVMEYKMDSNEFIAQMFEEKGDIERSKSLRSLNERIKSAIEVIRENGGCWA